MHRRPVFAALAAALLLPLLGALAPAAADPLAPTRLDLSGPATAAAGKQVQLTLALAENPGSGFPGEVVVSRSRAGGGWDPVTTVTTDAAGAATVSVTVSPVAGENTFGATYAGDESRAPAASDPHTVALAAEEPAPTALALEAPAAGLKLRAFPVRATLTRDGSPVAGETVEVQRRTATGWRPLGSARTGGAGRVSMEVTYPRKPARLTLRAVYAGSAALAAATSPEATVTGQKHPVAWTVSGPSRVVDETTVRLRFVLRTEDGQVAKGVRAAVLRRQQGTWKQVATRRTDERGRVVLKVRPRYDTRWRAKAVATTWSKAGRSPVHVLDNVPPGTPVTLPAGAPAPRVALPPQPRATGAGANVVVSTIPDTVWRSMVGRSWHSGCPVGRDRLRLVRANYWGYDGYRYRGELVVNADRTGKFVAALRAIYDNRLPIRSMYRVDRFGWSDRLKGGDDYKSMAAGNTSAFNCRSVVGRPGVRSPHSYGRAFDINPWENPYASPQDGWVPNSWWVSRSHPRVAWRSTDHLMVRTMRGAGFRWSYGTRDSHHFDG